MSRKATFKREEIVAKALQIVREKGVEGITARSLGAELGVSSSPIFTHFKSMDELITEVQHAASQMFDDYVADVVEYFPAFKEFGIRLVRFARQEPRLFNFLFFQVYPRNNFVHPVICRCLEEIKSSHGLTDEQTSIFFRQLWTLSCGLAMMGLRQPDVYNDDVVSEMLSCQYATMLSFLKSGREIINIHPHKCIEGENTILDI